MLAGARPDRRRRQARTFSRRRLVDEDHRLEQLSAALDHRGAIATIPHAAAALVAPVEICGEAPTQGLQRTAQRPARSPVCTAATRGRPAANRHAAPPARPGTRAAGLTGTPPDRRRRGKRDARCARAAARGGTVIGKQRRRASRAARDERLDSAHAPCRAHLDDLAHQVVACTVHHGAAPPCEQREPDVAVACFLVQAHQLEVAVSRERRRAAWAGRSRDSRATSRSQVASSSQAKAG